MVFIRGVKAVFVALLMPVGFIAPGAAENCEDLDSIKASAGVPKDLQSCHTALIDGYVIEGHVPAKDIKRLLNEMPAVTGLIAPSVPTRSPGMQEPGLPSRGYDLLSFNKQGKRATLSRY